MSSSYYSVSLKRLLKNLSVERIDLVLSTFSCPHNDDIESFLITRATDFAQQGIAQTHLVFTVSEGSVELVGFYALALKTLEIPANLLSKTYEKRVSRFGVLTADGKYSIAMPLIAQLGKNYDRAVHESIPGNELLAIACKKVESIQAELGGRFVYLECEDNEFLTTFYVRNGFRRISKEVLSGAELVQMLKFQ